MVLVLQFPMFPVISGWPFLAAVSSYVAAEFLFMLIYVGLLFVVALLPQNGCIFKTIPHTEFVSFLGYTVH